MYRNNNRDRIYNNNKHYREKNPGKVLAAKRKYQIAKLQRTPKWLTQEHFKLIEQEYILAAELNWLNTNEPMHVDHIVPLQGKNVSGLHVPWNLQIMPKTLNQEKRNKF